MLKRLNQLSCYTVRTERGLYLVSLKRIKNDINGNPRYEGLVHSLEVWGVSNVVEKSFIHSGYYRFTGHYLGEYGECEWLVNKYEDDVTRHLKLIK